MYPCLLLPAAAAAAAAAAAVAAVAVAAVVAVAAAAVAVAAVAAAAAEVDFRTSHQSLGQCPMQTLYIKNIRYQRGVGNKERR